MTVTINGTTGIAGVDGSASTPSVQGADTNTGMFFPAADTIAFAEGGAEVMRIDSSGNVGVGTSSPATSNGNVGKIVQAAASGNTSSVFVASIAGTGLDNAGIFEVRATAQTSGSDRIGQIYVGRENTSTTALSGYMTFATSGSGTLAERARIDSSGNLLVGTTSLAQRLSVTAATEVGGFQNTSGTGNVRFYNSGGSTIGYIQWSGASTSYVTSSDYRLKESVAPMTSGLATVSALKPVTYKWKEDGSVGEGFVAHELQEVIPFAVTGSKDELDENGNPEYQGVDYSKIVVHLVAAIQELKAQNDELKARLEALEAK
jgi:hypothetical protein